MTTGQLKIYRSSAGSGKTYTLVKEYLKIVLASSSPAGYRHVLAMTFTNKAAGEMKERVIQALDKLSKKSGESGYDEVYLLEISDFIGVEKSKIQERAKAVLHHMVHHYSDLSISTIDKFLHRIIRSFSRELNVPSDFQVQIDHDEILSQAVDELLEKAGSDPIVTEALTGYVQYKLTENKDYRLDRDLQKFAASLTKEDAQRVKPILKTIESSSALEFRKRMIATQIDFENRMAELGKEAIVLIDQQGLDISDFTYTTTGPAAFYYKLLSPPKDGYPDIFSKSYLRKSIEGSMSWYKKTTPEEIKSKIDGITDRLIDIHDRALKILEADHSTYKITKEVGRKLYSLAVAKELLENLDMIREREGMLLISDFNERIGEVIRSEPVPFIYERAGTRYDNFLLDEFQDTSAMQWQNIAPLVAESLSKGHDNLIVGDSKQAIYRWRNGDVEQFINLPEIPGADTNPHLKDHQFTLQRAASADELDDNWRSKSKVVEFNNRFFSHLIELNKSELSDAYASINQNVKRREGGYIEVKEVDKDSEGEVMQDYVRLSIENALNRGYRLSDIAILTRGKDHGSEVARHLLKNGFNVISQDSLLIYHHPSVKLIEAALRWITDPDNQHLRAKIMHWFCKVHEIDEDSTIAKYVSYKALESGKEMAQIDLEEFFRSMDCEIDPEQLRSTPLVEMVIKIARELRLDEFNDPFLQQFVEQVMEISGSIVPSLLDFLEKWDQVKEKVSVNLPEGIDAAQVMTIHKSKGLQFPIVIIPYADWMIRRGVEHEWVDIGESDLPIAMVSNSKNALSHTDLEIYAEREESKKVLDNLNMIYVAFTRAEDELYVCYRGFTSKDRIPNMIREGLGGLKQENHEGTFQFGTREQAEQRPELTKNENQIKSYTLSDLPEVSFTSEDFSSEAMDYGKMLHEVLSKANASTDIKSTINTVCKGVEELLKKQLEAEVSALFNNQEVMQLINSEGVTLNERTIMSGGKLYRPDRVVIHDNTADIIDFKTGEEMERDRKQVLEYTHLLETMGYNVGKKCLIYTSNATVKYV